MYASEASHPAASLDDLLGPPVIGEQCQLWKGGSAPIGYGDSKA